LIAEGHISYASGDPVEGKAGWHGFHTVLTGAYPDIKFEVKDQVVENDKVAARWAGTMVFKHPCSGIQSV
jgi:predicted ester cyclase